MPNVPQKRKRPPTFQHFPANRAKKLKKAWVEKAKIKSKWKAQKRREGIVSLRSGVLSPEHDDIGTADEHGQGGDYSNDSEPTTGAMAADKDSHAASSSDVQDEDEDFLSNTATASAAYSPSPPPQHHPPPHEKKYNQDNNKNRPLPHDKNNSGAKDGANANKEQDEPSLRDLFRKAYSKESLHTYKSGPLKKRRDEQHGRGRGRGRGGRGGNAALTSGRGQPNMKFRMNAILEKIKRDYS